MTELGSDHDDGRPRKLRSLRIGAAFALGIAVVVVLQLHARKERERKSPLLKAVDSKSQNATRPGAVDIARHDGKLLAAIHCSRCHPAPKPTHLPREYWPFMMTYMGNYLGYKETNGLFSGIVNTQLIPEQAFVSLDEVTAILDYYVRDSRPQKKMLVKHKPRAEMYQFQPYHQIPKITHGSFMSLVQFDDVMNLFYLGFGNQRKLELYSTEGEEILTVNCNSEPIYVEVIPNGFRLSEIGYFDFDHGAGSVHEYMRGEEGVSITPLVTNYHRLVESHAGDFDKDENEDLLLIGFGQGEYGRVSIYWGKEDDNDSRRVSTLIDYSGALHAELYDYDEDGDDDIFVLTAQRRQELILFENEGARRFLSHRLASQFAGFGFNSFTLTDFNGDHQKDLLLVNGNNMEIQDPPLRPYHGLRIMLHHGGKRFSEAAFFPLYGAIKAIAHDFDFDGDVDIAAIAFYPDWDADPPETFVYLENQGELNFRPHALDNAPWGRWLTMNRGDVDGDGDQDVLLGAAHIQLGISPSVQDRYAALIENAPSFLVLENLAR